MGLERSLVGVYVAGTRDDIKNYVRGPPKLGMYARAEYLGYLFASECIAFSAAMQLVDKNIRPYIAGVLLFDAAVRLFLPKKEDKVPRTLGPGLVGRVRELMKKK